MNIGFDWEEVDSLIGILHTQGISYLIGDGSSCSNNHGSVDPVHLIQRLAACGYPLVENASISLFILHPELAPSVLDALQSSEDETAENIAVVTLATLYLQQWWFFRLAFALGRLPCFPEAPFVSLWEDRHLPPPDSGYGLHGGDGSPRPCRTFSRICDFSWSFTSCRLVRFDRTERRDLGVLA